MKRPKLILFDMMGTLLNYRGDSRPYWHRLGELMASADIMAAETFNERYAAWRGHRGPEGTREITLRERLKMVAPALSGRQDLLDHLIDTYMVEYEARTERSEGVEEMKELMTTGLWKRTIP